MNDVVVSEKAAVEIDWKEFSRRLMYEGLVSASQLIVEATPNKIDDMTVNVIDKIGEFLLKPKAE